MIKRLHCPYGMKWSDVQDKKESFGMCSICSRNIIDIQQYSENEIIEIMSKDPESCIKLDLNNPNIRIEYIHGSEK